MLGAQVRDGAGGRDRRRRRPLPRRALRHLVGRGHRRQVRLAARCRRTACSIPKLREGFAELGKLGLTFDSWHFHPQLPDLVDLARAFPDRRSSSTMSAACWASASMPASTAEIMPAVEEEHRRARRVPQRQHEAGRARHDLVRLRLRVRATRRPRREELAETWRPYIETCIEAFGADRCMFESNFPPDKQSCGYTELWNAFKRMTKSASADEKTRALQRHRGAGSIKHASRRSGHSCAQASSRLRPRS